ncbi:MAG: hypothetical protein GY781_16690 [Gammaproteobacteria bacterium]|nr:hypothetical protein [Gammaproteobacteria bacterium]
MFFPNDSLWLISALLLLPGFWSASLCLRCLKKKRPVAAMNRGVISLVLLATGSAVGGLQTGMQGYRQLSDEQTVLHIETFPLSHQRFSVLVTWPDGEEKAFYLYGDQLYIDAQILKWKSAANVLGLQTYYELDRIGGRYTLIADEQEKPRSLYSLKMNKPVDLYTLVEENQWLNPLVDTSYGSATFLDVTEPGRWELRVSTSGLLIRKTGS